MEGHLRAVRKYYAARDFDRAFAHYRHVLRFGARNDMGHVTLRSAYDVKQPDARGRSRVAEIGEVVEASGAAGAAQLLGQRIATLVPCDPKNPLGEFARFSRGSVEILESAERAEIQIHNESKSTGYAHRVVSSWLVMEDNHKGAVELASKVGLYGGKGHRTHQGVKYEQMVAKGDVWGPRVYADAWFFRSVTLLSSEGGYDSALVFFPAPDRSSASYRVCVAWATYTALYACATKMSINAVVLPWMHADYKADVIGMLYDGTLPDESSVPPLAYHFDRVIIAGAPGSMKAPVRASASSISVPVASGSGHDGGSPVRIHSMGILGLMPGKTGPSEVADHVLVDPAGLIFITKNDPGGAGSLSGAIYEFVGITSFPPEVQRGIRKPGDAVYHEYGSGGSHHHVIHVVGPDFSKQHHITWHDAIAGLKEAYVNVLRVAESLPHEVRVVRIPLISGGVFAGKFKYACVPELTARAVVSAISEVAASSGPLLKEYWLCTFTEPHETALYARAFELARSVRHYDYKKQQFKSTASHKRIKVIMVEDPFGTVGYAASLGTRCKIGVMVAANSGRPGGSIGKALEVIPTIDHGTAKRGFNGELKTQEESVVSEWLYGECGGDRECGERLFRSTICGLWGQRARQSPQTIQGVDYTNADAAAYGDAWVVRDAKLQSRGRTDNVTATLVFVAGPNAQSEPRVPENDEDYGSMYYTANQKAARSYGEFKKGVEASVRAGLLAMQSEGITHALVAYVSGGIYAGDHKDKIRSDFQSLVSDVASAIRYDATIVIVDRKI